MEKQDIKESRKSTRFDLTSLVVIRCDVRTSSSDMQAHEFHTHSENISEDGINVILDQELRRLAPVELKLYLTGRVAPVDCSGQVMWSKIVSPAGVEPALFATGIKFVGMDAETKEAVRKIIGCF